MKTWLTHLWARISGSLWFMPVLMSFGAVGLVAACAALDDELARGSEGYLYAGDVESARRVLSTIASSVITVAGVSFSVTMVALSLTSSQFGPRLLANFMRDRGNQVVLGGFIGTFLFCLLALGTTTSGAEAYTSLSATVALLLAVFSLVLLIYFIHHIASSMQADQVIEQVAAELRESLDRLFPGDSPPEEDATGRKRPRGHEQTTPVAAPRTGYLQAVDEEGLIRLAARRQLHLRMLRRPGHFVIEGAPLLEADATGALDEDVIGRIRRGFIIGGHRTAEQDPEYGVHQLVEVAVRAMSAGINDPFTAGTCVDRLTGVLCRIAPRPVRPPVRLDEKGTPRLELYPIDFSGVLDAAFNQIRQFSGGIPSVSIRLLEGLADIARLTTDARRRDAVARHARMLVAEREDELFGDDRAALLERFHAVQQALQSGPEPAVT